MEQEQDSRKIMNTLLVKKALVFENDEFPKGWMLCSIKETENIVK